MEELEVGGGVLSVVGVGGGVVGVGMRACAFVMYCGGGRGVVYSD